MIRIRIVLYKISFLLFLGMIVRPANAQLTIGARALGMGQAGTGMPADHWALFNNPALATNAEKAVGFYGIRNYGFPELTDLAAAGSLPTRYGTALLGIHRYGDELFNKTRARLGYKNEWRNLHAGIVLNYSHIAFGGDYGSGGALGVDLGIAAELTDGLWLGARSININRPKYQGIREDLYRDMALGLSYQLNERALFALDTVKDVRYPVSYRGGVEILVIESLKGRVGVSTKPMTYSFGFGYSALRWQINMVVQRHQLLGLSPGLDLVTFF
ncbi:hypothetical protein [Gracilimonas mengyeensis]|uniref:Type IX secretion system membrane protein, PorP/SprF family n=1 Tax=Gracilimonas mengyeensis TaxID=1302730 RepID=A0A521BZJ7_9BACT|nr:hypothetical protein [Gracilimonas mengyeensis]SMO52574.1 hypothetical protein SAMN06265219_10424 [Gracilimonas mengyeensis]